MESLSVKTHVIELKSATTAHPLPFPSILPSWLATVVVLLVVHLTLRLIMILHNYRELLLLLLFSLQLSIENACRLSPAALDTRSTTINLKSGCTDTHTNTLTHTQLVGVSVEFAVSPCDLCAQS